MTKRQVRQSETLVRIRQFWKTHGHVFPEGSEAQKAFAAIMLAIAEIEALKPAKLTAAREGATKVGARQVLAAQLTAIAVSAQKLAKTVPGADIKFPRPPRQNDGGLLTSGQLFLKEAPALKDAFVRTGLREQFLDELQQAVTAFDAAIEHRQSRRVEAAVRQTAIRAALRKAMDAIDSLDAYVANTLGRDEKAMAAWKRSRRVDLSATTSPPSAETPAASLPAAETVATLPEGPAQEASSQT